MQVIDYKFDDAGDFGNGFAKVKKDDKWMYINIDGEKVIECSRFEGPLKCSEGLIVIKKDGKRGFINTQRKS